MPTIESNRCYYLDLAKVITTFLVVLGHLYSADSTVRLYLYGFHMPLFFFVSGIFHKYTGRINWLNYVRNILWPIFIFIILAITTNVLFHGKHLTAQLRSYFIDIALGKTNGILWFLYALFWCKIFLDIFCGFRNKLFPVFLWGCLLFIPVIFLKVCLPFALSQGMMAFPFYAIGFFGKDYLLSRTSSLKWGIPFVISSILTVLITKYLHGRVSMISVSFGNLAGTLFGDSAKTFPLLSRAFLRFANIALFYINGLIGSAMILSFSLLPWPKSGFVTSLSKSLITVVGTQYLFIGFINRWIGFNNHLVLSIGLSLCVFLLCFGVHQVLQPIYLLVKPSRRNNNA